MRPFELTVMMYHYVRDREDRAGIFHGIPGMPVAYFEAQLDSLMEHYQIISWPELCDHLLGRAGLPDRPCLLTFDDGVIDHYVNVFPALRARGLSGLFFGLARNAEMGITVGHKIHFLLAKMNIDDLRTAYLRRLTPEQTAVYIAEDQKYRLRYPGGSTADEINIFKLIVQRDPSGLPNIILGELFCSFVGSEQEIAEAYFLNGDQIQEMVQNGMHFGGHSQNHPWLDAISKDQQEQEIQSSSAWLSGIEAGPWAFAYPYGGFAEGIPEILSARGFLSAFTTCEQSQQRDPFFIGRYDAEEFARDLSPLVQSRGGQ